MPPRQLMPSAAITRMPFEDPYTTPMRPFGKAGLNLKDAQDQLSEDEFQILNNVDIRGLGQMEARWGLFNLAQSAGTKVHSMKRLDDPLGNQATRIWGVDTTLRRGISGAMTTIDTGYSGEPLHLVPKRPEQSGDSWMYVADKDRMRKVRFDGLDLPIGIPKAAAPTSVLVAEQRTPILQFDTSDTSEAAVWRANIRDVGPTDPAWQPNVGDLSVFAAITPDWVGKDGDAVLFTAIGTGQAPVPEGSSDPWFWTSIPLNLNLDMVGTREAKDDDVIHFWISMAKALLIMEFRIYFITTDPLNMEVFPGRHADANRNAFVKIIRPNEVIRGLAVFERFVDSVAREAPKLGDEDFIGTTETDRDLSTENASQLPPGLLPVNVAAGETEWHEFGAPGRPFRRGSFYKMGEPDWSQVTGCMIMIRSDGAQGGGGGVVLDDLYLTGGYGPDSTDAASEKYDVRVTDFDSRTGTEGNPSDIQEDDLHLEPVRRGITVTPQAVGDAAMRQRIYVRGGFNNFDWSRAGQNDADGDPFTIEDDDTELAVAATLELDHDEPVTTEDTDGETILAVPVPVIIDIGDLLIGLGEKNRPGHIYWPIPGEFGHWPPQNTAEVCPPSEELMGGVAWGGQAYIFSRERMFIAYQNVTAPGTVLVTNTSCNRGLHSPWAICKGERGIYAVDTEGIFVTTGGLPREVADKLYPIFHRESKNGYEAINMSKDEEMRLRANEGRIYFQYEDATGVNRIAVYDERRDIWIGIWTFNPESGTIEIEPHESITPHIVPLYIGGKTGGDGFAMDPTEFADDGNAITALVRTSRWAAGIQRENKQLGDAIVDLDASLTAVAVTVGLDQRRTVNATSTVPATNDGRNTYILDIFGTEPQFAKTAEFDFGWTSATRRPTLYEWGVSFIPIPEETNLRSTQWDDLASSNEKYVTGIEIECDTFNVARPFIVEYDLGGTLNTAFSGSVTSNGRHKFRFSWPVVKANLIRLRPITGCAPWILFKTNYMSDPEPPRIARLDSNDEEHYDSYYTGIDLTINTLSNPKTFEFFVDGVLLVNPATGGTTFTVNTTRKEVVHISFTPAYGHIFRHRTTDDNDCLLYAHRWFLSTEPSEQTNWNQGFTVAGTRADKWVKGVQLEVDTFGVSKVVTVEVDHVVADTFTINTNGRRVIQQALTAQVRGRVIRIYSVDNVPSRLWPPPEGIFDVEPLALKRYETQEITHGIDGWQIPLMAEICYRSTDLVTVSVTVTISDDGVTVTDTYTVELPSTADAKQKRKLFFVARKGLLFKYVFTSPADFYLYREESELHVQPWGVAGEIAKVKIFGNDAMDADRGMRQRPVDSNVQPLTPMVPPVPTPP